MARPVTLFTIQWGDLSLEDICALAKKMGYEGLELSAAHLNMHKAATDPEYVSAVKAMLAKYDLKCWAVSNHLAGQCVVDTLDGAYDARLDGFAPGEFAGQPDKIQSWAVQEMKDTAYAAKAMGVDVVTFFMGSPIWKYWYSFPQTSEEMVEEGYRKVKELWSPIMDVYDECGVRLALEVHPTEIAFDIVTAKRLLETLDYREEFGFNFDPSHLFWQGMNPVRFIQEFPDRIFHVHMKDAGVQLDGVNGVLCSHINFGDARRGWDFRSLGHGDVNFEEIIRALNHIDYQGPLSVEWEDSGMDRIFGATEAFEFVKKINFSPSKIAFDGQFDTAVKNQANA